MALPTKRPLRFLTVNGWSLALAKHKPKSRTTPAIGTTTVTVGSFLDAVFAVSTNRSTIECYATAFRKIVADLFGLSDDPAKVDHRSGGRAKWLAKIHAIELGKITPARIQEWKQSFLATAGDDSLTVRKALYTPNKAAAATRARDIYLFLLANGWEPALAKYRKPKAVLHEHSGDRKSVQAEQLLGHFSKSDIQGCQFQAGSPARIRISEDTRRIRGSAPVEKYRSLRCSAALHCSRRSQSAHLMSRRQRA